MRAVLVAALLLAVPSSAAAQAPSGTWSGSFRLPASAPAPAYFSLDLRPRPAAVSIGAGHPARTAVSVKTSASKISFSLPGRPGPLVFEGTARGGEITGTVRQGALRGSFRLRRGVLSDAIASGAYRLASGHELAAYTSLGNWLVTDYGTGEIHGLFRTAPAAFDIGSGLLTRNPVGGKARFSGTAVDWRGEQGTRIPLRQEEVRFRSGGVSLSGTLTLPPGPGPHPAVVLVHGSGNTPRDTESTRTYFFALQGLAVLAYDKRGTGLSAGRWPGEFPSDENLQIYARDAEAAARFLAAQPEVDRRRVGLAGGSQAGWIMPLAASREPAVRFLVVLVGPTVSPAETSAWASLTGAGGRPLGRPLADLEAEVAATTPDGFDPLPSIRRLTIPSLWLWGGNDLSVPTRLCLAALAPIASEPGRDFSSAVLPRGAHSLIDTDSGLDAEVARSSRFAEGLWQRIAAWLRARDLSGA